jgi:predicted nucleic acid-binding protein
MDADVTIALLKSGTIGVLDSLTDFKFMITEIVYDEINHESERAILDGAIAEGIVGVTELSDPAGLVIFGDLLRVVDDGEASVIALATVISGDVAMHDRAGRREAASYLSLDCVHRFEDIIVEAIRCGRITVSEANEAVAKLAKAGDYQPPFAPNGFEVAVTNPTFGLGPARDRAGD